mmetsp:Transcript_57832/g.155345  ORF Transcript_57832/g.155345 Transcript_57832/m.155345 type:complete len:159 (+) Transcript_57832:27-503(+)
MFVDSELARTFGALPPHRQWVLVAPFGKRCFATRSMAAAGGGAREQHAPADAMNEVEAIEVSRIAGACHSGNLGMPWTSRAGPTSRAAPRSPVTAASRRVLQCRLRGVAPLSGNAALSRCLRVAPAARVGRQLEGAEVLDSQGKHGGPVWASRRRAAA